MSPVVCLQGTNSNILFNVITLNEISHEVKAKRIRFLVHTSTLIGVMRISLPSMVCLVKTSGTKISWLPRNTPEGDKLADDFVYVRMKDVHVCSFHVSGYSSI